MKLSVFEEVSVFFFFEEVFTKGRNFSSLCETGMKKKTGSRSRVCNEVNIGIPLHWSAGLFLSITSMLVRHNGIY